MSMSMPGSLQRRRFNNDGRGSEGVPVCPSRSWSLLTMPVAASCFPLPASPSAAPQVLSCTGLPLTQMF